MKMTLQSEFLDSDKLRDCEVKDIDHVGEQFSPRGPWVVLIKKALNAWAAKQTPPLAPLPLTDIFGSETGDRVALYKTRHVPPILNYQGKIDRIVGKKTVAALDKELPARGGGSTITPDMQLVNAADVRRLSALQIAEVKLRELKAAFEPDVPDLDNPVVQALQRQLFIVIDSTFWPTVDAFLSMVITNRLTRAPFQIDRADTANFAHVDPSNDPARGITFCNSFFTTNDNCRQEVITHEFFHFIVGLQHFYAASTNSDAMQCPHHLARAVFDIVVGQRLAPCSASGNICR